MLAPPPALFAAIDQAEHRADVEVAPWSADEVIELDRAIALAVDNNRDLERSRINHSRARLGRVSAEREFFDPSLRAAWEWREEGDTQSSSTTLSSSMKVLGATVTPSVRLNNQDASGDDNSTSVSLAVSRPLLRLHAVLADRMPLIRADHQTWQALLRRLETERDIRLQTIRSWFAVVRVRARVAIRETRVTDAEAFLQSVEARVAAGFAAPIDATSARISLNQARADLVNEQASLRSSYERLNDLLGAPIAATPLLPASVNLERDFAAIDADNDLVLLLDRHERILAARLRLQLAGQELLLSYDTLRPNLDATVRVEQSWQGNSFPATEDGEQTATLGLSLALPLDGWRSERATVLRNKLSMQSLELDLADAKSNLISQHRRALRDVERLARTNGLAAERLEIEQSRLAANLERYEQGSIDNIEVTRSQQSVDQARLSLLEARIEAILAHAGYQSLLPPRGSEDVKNALLP